MLRVRGFISLSNFEVLSGPRRPLGHASLSLSPLMPADVFAVLTGLVDRAAALKDLASLKQLGPEREADLEVIALQVQDLEAKVAAQRAEVAQQTKALRELRTLKDEAMQTGIRLLAVQAAVPAHLPGEQSSRGETPQHAVARREPLGELSLAAAPPAPPQPEASGGGATHRRGGKLLPRQPPVLAYVKEDELASAPQYMRSRLGVEKLNSAVGEIQRMLNEKYALLSTPPSQLRALSEAGRKQHASYKEAESEQTKGLFFLSEADLKTSHQLKQDATGKNILAVLRHVGRLREFKPVGAQHRCWHTR